MTVIELLKAAAVLTVVFSLLTALDLPQHLIELFSHFRLQYFVASVLLFLVFALLQQYAYAGALLLTVLLNGMFIISWYLPLDDEGGGPETLKLLHANVLSSNDKHQRLIDLVAAEDPDMIFLQEVTDDWVSGLRPLQTDYPYFYTEARSGNFGIAVYSKIRLDSVSHVDSPPLAYPTITATATIGKQNLTLISSHPTIPLGKRLYSARNQQLDSVLELVEAAEWPVVFLGDLNATVWDPQFKKFVSSSGLSNARHGFGLLATWPTYLPFAMIPIDHVLVSEGIGVTQMKTGRSMGSDHLPLIVTLSL